MNGLSGDRGVPFLDLALMNGQVADDVRADFDSILETSMFINGPRVDEFEKAFASYCGVQHCVGVASGLDALRLALTALGLEAGDEVLVPAMTFVATFEAVSQAGGVPVPVDVSELGVCIDPVACAAALGAKTRVIMPVHLYGRLAEMGALTELALANDVAILEDACQAHGAHRGDIRAGAAGTAAAFSFYPGKNLGAFGDAGAMVTDDAELASAVRSLREHGQRQKYEHEAIGWTARLDAIQAAVLLRKLPLLDRWNDERRAVAALYDQGLRGIGDLLLPDVADAGQVWHLYAVRTSDRAGLATHLAERGIGTARHYPEPPHLSKAYEHLGFQRGSFPVAEQVAIETLSLPLFPGMSESQVERVVTGVRSWFVRG